VLGRVGGSIELQVTERTTAFSTPAEAARVSYRSEDGARSGAGIAGGRSGGQLSQYCICLTMPNARGSNGSMLIVPPRTSGRDHTGNPIRFCETNFAGPAMPRTHLARLVRGGSIVRARKANGQRMACHRQAIDRAALSQPRTHRAHRSPPTNDFAPSLGSCIPASCVPSLRVTPTRRRAARRAGPARPAGASPPRIRRVRSSAPADRTRPARAERRRPGVRAILHVNIQMSGFAASIRLRQQGVSRARRCRPTLIRSSHDAVVPVRRQGPRAPCDRRERRVEERDSLGCSRPSSQPRLRCTAAPDVRRRTEAVARALGFAARKLVVALDAALLWSMLRSLRAPLVRRSTGTRAPPPPHSSRRGLRPSL